MSTSASSTSRHALHTPELLRHIFDYLTHKDNSSNALVCKAWTNDALNVIWEVVDDFRRLMNLLAPHSFNLQQSRHTFSRSLQPDDWVRWDKYAWRVHCLSDPKWSLYHASVFNEIAATKPSHDLLPNLQTLDYDNGQLSFLSLLVQPKVLHFSCVVTPEDLTASLPAPAFLSTIATKMPLLQTLYLSGCSPADIIEMPLGTALRELRSLKSLTVSSHWLTEEVTEAVANHPRLEKLAILPENKAADHSKTFTTVFDAKSFPVLKHLCVFTPFKRLALSLSHKHRPALLSQAYLHSVHPETVAAFTRLLQVVCSSYPHLDHLSLITADAADLANFRARKPIPFSALQPLFQCHKVVDLHLHFCVLPISTSATELLSLVEALPLLRELFLSPAPQLDTIKPSLSISVLPSLIPLCPNLERLGLFMDATGQLFPPVKGGVVFKQLRVLDVGYSPIGAPIPVARFLASLFLKGVHSIPSTDSRQTISRDSVGGSRSLCFFLGLDDRIGRGLKLVITVG